MMQYYALCLYYTTVILVLIYLYLTNQMYYRVF